MRTTRRAFVTGAGACATASLLLPGSGAAQGFPTQPIRAICAFPPGSGADVLVRWFAEELRTKTGATVVVENRVGAAGNIAAEHVARARPDGYRILVHAGSSTAANYSLFKKPPINPAKDLQVVATLNQQPFMVVVPADSPYKTLRELIEGMKKKGDTANYAQSNTTGRVIGELFRKATGITAVMVPYRTSADTLPDFAKGALDYGVMDPVSSLANERAGRWRLLAVSSPERVGAVPQLPTMKEEGVAGVDLFGWWAAMLPAGAPRPLVDQYNKWFNEILASPRAKTFLNEQGGDPWISTPEEGQAQLVKDQEAWATYVKMAGIEPQ